ncbi:MAG: class II fumarate hydratase [Acidimicrobiales bacterium]
MAEPAGGRRWGRQTDLAIANFPISGEPVPADVVRALGEIKYAAAVVNERHGSIDAELADAVMRAADEVADGEWADQFPVDVFQTGSGTSTNMNVNEVIAHRAGELLGRAVHPNDHVNRSQSSNDVFPSAIRLAAAALIVDEVVPALALLATELRALAARHRTTVKMGRTHLMDAVPMTFGQEVDGWARAIELGVVRVEAALDRVLELPIGGTAVGTGLNAPRGFGADVAAVLRDRTGLAVVEATDHVEAQSSHDALVELSGEVRTVALSLHKVAGDLRLLSSGPTGGLAELRLAELQAGSSIMPGKVNPVIPEAVQQVTAQIVGNDATITFAATLSTLQLSTAGPIVARATVSSLRLLAAAATVLRERCLGGLEVDTERMATYARRSPAVVTALAPVMGYDAAAALVHEASDSGRSIGELARERGVADDVAARVDDLLGMAGVSADDAPGTPSA